MKYLIIAFLALPCFMQAQSEYLKTPDATSFLKEMLGAKYSKSDKFWVLPRTTEYGKIFGTDAEGGLFSNVDTILMRKVGDVQEAWILFTVEGYMFNFARLEKTPKGWKKKSIFYKFHEGAPGEYQPEYFGFQMIAQKTFISIKESWYGAGITTQKWLLFDPFNRKEVGSFELNREGEKEQRPESFKEIKTIKTKLEVTDQLLPDIIFEQAVLQKLKGKKEQESIRTLRYIWNATKSAYEKAKE